MMNIGIDLGGTGIKVGVVDDEGRILLKDSCPTLPERGHEAVIHDMAQMTRKVVDAAGLSLADIGAVGVGIPGIEDTSRGIVPFCTNLGWHEVPLTGMLSGALGKPVFMGNDATVAALAESVAGAGKGMSSVVLITLGTGVGGGIVLNGRPYSGAHGVASEVGHMVIKYDGVMCTCGHRGCWERYASATALIREGREAAEREPDGAIMRACEGDLKNLNAKIVVDLAREGDRTAARIFDQYATWIAIGLGNLVNLYDPEVFLLGGGVSAAGDFLLDAVRAKMADVVFYRTMRYGRIELATLGNDAGIIGAAMLASIG